MTSWKDHSRASWYTPASGDPEGKKEPGVERIQVGAIQRIADAVELMAKDRVQLEQKLQCLEKNVQHYRGVSERLRRSNAALRGHLRRVKNKQRTA